MTEHSEIKREGSLLPRPGWAAAWLPDEAEKLSREAWRAVRAPCPRCGQASHSFFGKRSKCSVEVAMAEARADDLAWFRRHSDTIERIRPVTVAEQLHRFLWDGMLYDTVRLVRSEWYLSAGEQQVLLWLYDPIEPRSDPDGAEPAML